MISAGVDGRLPYMTYPEPWRGPPKQPHPVEFLRPAPKPLQTPNAINNNSKYSNGMISTNLNPNSTRLGGPPPPRQKYPNQATIITPVNLTQPHKEDGNTATTTLADDLQQFNAYARLFPQHNAHFTPFPPYSPAALYSTHYAHMMRQAATGFTPPQTPLSPLETFSPTSTNNNSNGSTFLISPSYSPPSLSKVKDSANAKPTQSPNNSQNNTNFKVPSGKEGSLKHRILTLRPEDLARNGGGVPLPLDLQLLQKNELPRKRLMAATTLSPPTTPAPPPKKIASNAIVPVNFSAGSLIQLANGDLRRIEDMRTEDFINSAENNPELRLAESTVVKIDEKTNGFATITLSYNQRRTQVEVESSMEHPFFIYGQGWASCNPEKTQQNYKLKVNKLQVGDILVSLTPREANMLNNFLSTPNTTSNITTLTSSTNTSMISRQITTSNSSIQRGGNTSNMSSNNNNTINNDQIQPLNLHSSNKEIDINKTLSDNRKRRWSAPDQICENNETNASNFINANSRRHRVE